MAGLHIYRSNRLEVLVSFLAAQLHRGATDPLVPREVVVGSRGMERHLRHALAQELGICAHIEFPFPVAALDGLTSAGDGPDPWGVDALTWAVLEVLPEVARQPGCEVLSSYLSDDSSGPIDARSWGLAREIADTFDRYITYRPELAIAWSEGEAPPLDAPLWQARLWAAVNQQLRGAPHRAQRLLAGPQALPSEEPLHIFGLSGLAASWLHALGEVARHRSVELYLLCPSEGYWADLERRLADLPDLSGYTHEEAERALAMQPEAGHPLLMSWGRSARDLQILVESVLADVKHGDTDLFVDPSGEGSQSALRLLQADILKATHPAQRDLTGRTLAARDHSVQIHACHGPTRQVEALRTAITALLDADPSLQPRDIVVMTPSVDEYAPLVQAVFDTGAPAPGPRGWADAPRLPLEIADLAVRRVNPVADALLTVLHLVDDRAGADTVLDLLALPPVAGRFEISLDALPDLRRWVIDSGIRWGADAAHRAARDQPADAQNTWRFGLDRLLMGVIMAEDERLPAGISPLPVIEGGGVRLLGQFAEFCAALFDQLDRLAVPRPLEAWARDLDETLHALTRVPADEAWLARSVRDTLEALAREAGAASSARPVQIDALRAALAGRFEGISLARQGRGGAITFCGMVPERAVPYRVVCLLGMDEGSFPRVGLRPAFDEMQRHPRVGDRTPRDDDRYMLLEAVLSARDHLLVFYTGRDPHTGEPRPPAVGIRELTDALDLTFPEADPPPSARFTRLHTLAAFDPRNFQSEAPASYDTHLLEAVRAAVGLRQDRSAFLHIPRELPAGPPETVELSDLLGFWRHPLRAFMQRRLRLWLPRDDEGMVPDREPVELSYGARRGLVMELLAARLRGEPIEPLQVRMRAMGILPLGAAGEVVIHQGLALAEAMREAANLQGADATSAIELDVAVGPHRVVGQVEGCTSQALIRFAYGDESRHRQPLLDAWIELLALRHAWPDAPRRAVIVYGRLDTRGRPQVSLIGLEPDAEDSLLPLLDLRAGGLQAPLPYLPKTSQALARKLYDGLRSAEDALEMLRAEPWPDAVNAIAELALASARSAWFSGAARGEDQDRYCRHAFGGAAPFEEGEGLRADFAVRAMEVWGPLFRARRTSARVRLWGTG